ncbi:hypothetical protein [uncultured Methanobrevibacter sp.]|uniref:hypothetical protein n=1 Tax=uncultured Methanobrevibacter sp. TaxID=253161 RepID=UPI00262F764B
MADSLDIFTGVLLTAVGLVLVYGSIVYRLIDLILILGVLITLFGLYKLLPAFIMRILNSHGNAINNLLELDSSSNSKQRLNQSTKSQSRSGALNSSIQNGAKEVGKLIKSTDDKISKANRRTGPKSKSNESSRAVLRIPENSESYDDESTSSDFSTDYQPSERKDIFKDNSIDESKMVLKTKSQNEEKSKFKLPSIKRNSSRSSPNGRTYGYLDDRSESAPVNSLEGQNEGDKVYFTPNYEKPMKVTRKPKRKSHKVSNIPRRSKEISEALATVGETETIYDNSSSDDSYTLIPKVIDDEVILPISDFGYDEDENETVYNLAQSENTSYNNVIFDEASDESFSITPIHAESDYEGDFEESNQVSASGDYEEINQVSAYGDYEEINQVSAYGDYEEINQVSEYETLLEESLDDGSFSISPISRETVDVNDLPRPTSVSSTNPISKKSGISNLSRPHKKEVPKADEDKSSGENKAIGSIVDSVAGDSGANAIPDSGANVIPDSSTNAIPDFGANAIPDSSVESIIDSGIGSIPNSSAEESIPGLENLQDVDNIGTSLDDLERDLKTVQSSLDDLGEEKSDLDASKPQETIKIDPNNPESLPIPKLLNSYVICEKGILTSQEAFEEVASHSKEEILLEAPTIKDMGERFLSSIAQIKTRIIIQEFDLEDISYVLLLSSLIKKGVEIKTMPLVNSFNLIGDTSHALLISNSVSEDDFEYGAVYTDKDSVENIKELFNSSWEIAKDLEINVSTADES